LLGDISPQNYLALDESQVRECGLSRSKIRYITNIAQALEQGVLTPLTWHSMTDRAVAEQLISIPGIGMWTAEMFLIFHLHRADILPLGDIGLIKAIELHYAAGNKLTKAEILDLARPWQPYRTVATWYLWRSLDPHPVQY
jgi:DNA-3-methyladenine glycosylase II